MLCNSSELLMIWIESISNMLRATVNARGVARTNIVETRRPYAPWIFKLDSRSHARFSLIIVDRMRKCFDSATFALSRRKDGIDGTSAYRRVIVPVS